VENGKIGIKVADGSFYPILDEGVSQKKRLVLTTVKDNQESVQIDLYKGSGEEMENAAYVGSLLVEKIAPDMQGNAEVELVVGVDEEGNLESVAEDKKSGSKQSLSVSLKNLDESGLYEVPDFSFEEEGTDVENIFDTEELGTEELDTENLASQDFGEDLEAEDFGAEDLGVEDFGEETGAEEFGFEDSVSQDFGEEADFEAGSETDLESDFTEISEPELEDSGDLGIEDIEEGVFDELPDFDQETESDLEEPFADQDFEFDQEMQGLEEAQGQAEPAGVEPAGVEAGGEDFEDEFEEEPEKEPEEESKSKARPILVALLVILAIGLIGALLYLFVFMAADKEAAPPLQSQQEQQTEGGQIESEEQPVQETVDGTSSEQDSGEDTEQVAEQAPPEGADEVVVSPSKDQVEFTGGVWYKVRWGDTLWEISSSFYDNPWLYDKIAEENEIRDPDIIYAENSIFIPKKK